MKLRSIEASENYKIIIIQLIICSMAINLEIHKKVENMLNNWINNNHARNNLQYGVCPNMKCYMHSTRIMNLQNELQINLCSFRSCTGYDFAPLFWYCQSDYKFCNNIKNFNRICSSDQIKFLKYTCNNMRNNLDLYF